MQTQLIAKQGAQRQLCDLLVRAWASHLHRRARLLHRLQDLFWRVWTCRQFDLTTSWGQSLGKCSRRDAYIYHRAAALVPQLIKHGIIADHDAAANSRVVNISDARRSGGRTAGTRKVDEAGIPATPGSARSRKKSAAAGDERRVRQRARHARHVRARAQGPLIPAHALVREGTRGMWSERACSA